MQFTRYSNSPEIYRKWSALATISAALQRKVWLRINGSQIFPNLFVLLCGAPGIGKSQAINPCRDLLSELPNICLSPARTSPEKFIQLMCKSTRMLPLENNPYFTQSAYAVFMSEFSTFLRPNDKDFMTVLTDLYDCAKTWTYATLARDEERIENVYLTMIGGITPKALAENFGAAAFGMGFTARLNIIYSEDYKTPKLFGQTTVPDFSPLLQILSRIHALSGEFTFEPDAAEELQAWVDEGMPPIPSDGRLAEYVPRRWLHLVKLCMIYSACESNSLRVAKRHLAQARSTLLEAESVLAKAVEYLGTNPMMEAVRNIHAWLKLEYRKSKTPILEKFLKHKLLHDVGPQYINQFILELVNSGYAQMVGDGPTRAYIPL